MTADILFLVGVAVVALLAAVGAFAIAWRRSTGADSWKDAIGRETRRADRSQSIAVPEPAVEETVPPLEQEEPEVEAEPVAASVAVAQEQRVVEVSPEEAGVTRRRFFNRALAAAFFAYVGVLGIQLLAFMWPKLRGGFGADVDAGAVSDLVTATRTADGGVIPAFIPEARAYVVPVNEASLSGQFANLGVAAGGLMALYQKCVHLGCRVPWCDTSQGFECPCHGSKYDYIGEYFGGPAPRNLDRFEVEVVNDRFLIKTGRIIQSPRAPSRTVPYPQGPSCIGAVGEEE
ncbi:MAG TPA: ubiquinol-cytochrome c reductase iron-sulfur subunit [Acidimicrobiia bacterium]|nr:ubiquinol-cytochrome c reductase iron-sulfur subunit [Acidimicrobiia bacterium]